MRLAAFIDAQPKSPARPERDRNARLLEALIRSSDQLLRRHVRKHAELPEDAEDALQRSYLLFLERYDGRWEPLPWLSTTIKREAWALRRRAHRNRELSLDAAAGQDDAGQALSETIASGSSSTEERVCSQELLDDRRRALTALKPDHHQALWLFGLGYSYAEICRLTGWTHTKVNRSNAEGRAELRRRLAEARG